MIDISIVLPIYNASKYLLECVESCIHQTFDKNRYEIVCCDDGSTDGSLEILNKIKLNNPEYNIQIISKIHTGIADTINTAINKSNGKYIAIMNSDDISLNNRLEIQYNILKQNNDVDVLSCGFIRFPQGNPYKPTKYEVTMDMMKKNNYVANPTVMFRKEILNKLPYLFEQYFSPADDYKFWCMCVQHGIRIWNYPDIVLKYRCHTNQVTHTKQMIITTNRIKRLYNNCDYQHLRELTVIITFNNEGIEVEKTIQSIFATTKHTKIILIDDCSDDNFNYKELSVLYNNVKYIRNVERKGVAESRNIGVKEADTEYCVLIDAHMRFYAEDWDIRVISLLKKYNNSILCSHTVVIKKDENNYYINEDDSSKHIASYGAVINLDYTKERCFRHKWNYEKIEPNTDNLLEVDCVLGAFYCFTKSHWNNIHGLTGLIKYGLDEAVMSLKTRIFGGKCYVINDLYVGHIYRDVIPYTVLQSDVAFNEYLCIELFIPEYKKELYMKNLYNRLTEQSIKTLEEYKVLYKNIIDNEKQYILNNTKIDVIL
jgi:glycosyltransferase involved in cell wall biosynthesis